MPSYSAEFKEQTVRKLQAIRQAEAQRENAELADIAPVKPGMTVEIQASPLAGIQALVQAVSKDRVTLLLHMLGRPQSVQVDIGQVQPL